MDEHQKLLQELYGKVEHKSLWNKCYCAVKDYWTSPVPIMGAIFGAGAVYVTSFIVGSAYSLSDNLSDNFSQFAQARDWQSALYSIPSTAGDIYHDAQNFANDWVAAGAAAGQFIFYRAKNSVKAALGKLVKKND